MVDFFFFRLAKGDPNERDNFFKKFSSLNLNSIWGHSLRVSSAEIFYARRIAAETGRTRRGNGFNSLVLLSEGLV